MNPLIECCEQNLSKSNQSLLANDFITTHGDVITYSCMNECQLCANNDYALFEGEVIIANSPEELKEKLKNKIVDWEND